MEAGVVNVVGTDRKGAIWEGRDDLNPAKKWFAENTNRDRLTGSLAQVLPGADVFIGVSGPGLLTADDLRTMGSSPIVFAMANPDPEIRPEQAEGIAAVVATGRSDFPNQINNVLCFPGIFRGALDRRRHSHHRGMKLAAANAIASAVGDDELAPDFIIPSVFDKRVARLVAQAAADAAGREGVVRRRDRPLKSMAAPSGPVEAVTTFDFWNTLVHPDDDATRRAFRRLAVQAVLGDFGHRVDDDRLDDTFRRTFDVHHTSWVANRQFTPVTEASWSCHCSKARPRRRPTRDRDRGLRQRRRRSGHAPHRSRGRSVGRAARAGDQAGHHLRRRPDPVDRVAGLAGRPRRARPVRPLVVLR